MRKECGRLYDKSGVWIEEGCQCGCWGDDPCGRSSCPHESTFCKSCKIIVPQARAELGYQTCIKHSDEKTKDHQPGVVNSLGLHEKYFPEGR